MKKRTKIALANTLLSLVITSTSIVIISQIVANNNKHIFSNLQKLTNSNTWNLTNRSTFLVNGKNNSNTVSLNNQNNFKAVPNGYVFIDNNGSLVCVDKDDPTNQLWWSSENYNVAAIEYTPYNDSLVVLQVEQDPNASDAYLVFVKAYNNISTIETGEKIGPSTPKYQIYRYNGSLWYRNIKPLSWSLAPIYKETGVVTDFLVYSRGFSTFNNNVRMLRIKLNQDNTITSTSLDKTGSGTNKDFTGQNVVTYPGEWHITQAIAAFDYRNQLHTLHFTKRHSSVYKDKPTWVGVEHYVDAWKWEGNKMFQQLSSDAGIFGDGFLGETDDDSISFISNAIQSSITSVSTSYDQNTKEVQVAFADNLGGNKTKGIHRASGFFITGLNFNQSALTENRYVPLWRNWKIDGQNWPSIATEVWSGNFFTSPTIAKGLTVNTNWSNPFIAKGWDSSWDSSYNSEAGNGGFIGVITQPIDYNRQYDLSPTSNESFARIYMQAYNKSFDRSNSNIYTTLKGGNYNDQNGTGWYQNAYDVPVIQYDDSSLSTSIFDKNIFVLRNGTQEGLFINQKNRGTIAATSVASYGYFTKTKSETIEIDISNEGKFINEINHQYLTEKYAIESTPWNNSSFLSNDLGMSNVRDDALFYINPNINIDARRGQATFDLYVTIKYNETGNLRTISSEDLKNNWNSEFRVCSVTLTGLKVANPTSAIIQTNLEMSNISALDFSLSKNNDEIKRIIFDKRNEIFNNTLPTDFELSNIVSIIEKNVANSEGTITITFSIDKYYNDKGLLEEVEPKNFTIKFIGFKADDRTTSINPQLTNVENILPSQYENNLELIKNSIINNIENVYSPLDINDIEVTFNEPNDLIGTINANIKIINSKALQNGNIQQEFSLNNVVLSGFKIKKETTNIIPNIKAIQLGLFDLNINKAKEKINEEFIVMNKDKFFNGDIQLNNANEILNLEVSIQNNSLVVSFKLKANTWYDENGQLGSIEKDFKTNISGFKEENKKTSNLAQIIGGILLVIGGVLTIGIVTFMFIKSKKNKKNN
ncbi:hypothetical protein [Mesomycoplasma moatsii]|uniref:hypothetical protein n=1 Tax=Mesomycoplasma moatsii TaxID=171287 RepID=UPI0038F63B94